MYKDYNQNVLFCQILEHFFDIINLF